MFSVTACSQIKKPSIIYNINFSNKRIVKERMRDTILDILLRSHDRRHLYSVLSVPNTVCCVSGLQPTNNPGALILYYVVSICWYND